MNLMSIAEGAVQSVVRNKEKWLLAGGFIFGAGTIGFAIKGTIDAKKVLEEHEEVRDLIKEAEEVSEEYKDSDSNKKDIVRMYAMTGIKMAKVYSPAIGCGVASACCFIMQYKSMEQKVTDLEETVASLSAAYLAVSTAFKKYRKRVVDKYGEKEDRYFRYGETEDTVEVTEMKENGKTKTTKQKVKFVDEPEVSDYAKFFDSTSSQFIFQDPMKYKADWDANIRFLNIQQSYANAKLESQGYLFLNDVYDMLGLPMTKAGQVVGWIFDPEDKTIDSRVDFGIFEPRNHRTINGYEEECMLLDFNVDGVIIDKIKSFGDK